jgi:hypothetical protein
MAQKTVLNQKLDELVTDLAKQNGMSKEDVLVQSVALLKYLKEHDAVSLKAKKADGTEVDVELR